MQIVAVIHHRVDARSRAALDVRLIRKRRFLVRLQRGFIIARANVNVRWHVHDVSGGRRELRQAICSRQRALRRIGGLDGMNVIVNRAKMVRLAANHGLERCNDFFRTFCRRAVRHPQSPRMQIHSRFRGQRRGVQVVREALHHLAHGVAILF